MESRLDRLDEKMDVMLELMNKMVIKSETNRHGGFFDIDDGEYREIKPSTSRHDSTKYMRPK